MTLLHHFCLLTGVPPSALVCQNSLGCALAGEWQYKERTVIALCYLLLFCQIIPIFCSIPYYPTNDLLVFHTPWCHSLDYCACFFINYFRLKWLKQHKANYPLSNTCLVWSNEHEMGHQLLPIPSEVGGVMLCCLKQKTWPGALLVSSLKEYLCLWLCQRDHPLILLAKPICLLWKMQWGRTEKIVSPVPAVNLLGSFRGRFFVSLT